jgi:hypothetical protein
MTDTNPNTDPNTHSNGDPNVDRRESAHKFASDFADAILEAFKYRSAALLTKAIANGAVNPGEAALPVIAKSIGIAGAGIFASNGGLQKMLEEIDEALEEAASVHCVLMRKENAKQAEAANNSTKENP